MDINSNPKLVGPNQVASSPEEFKMSNNYHLGVFLTIIVLQILSIIGNGFIILLFIRTKRLRKNVNLRLILLLSITDWLFAVSHFPYMINFIVNWYPDQYGDLDYEPIFLIIASAPLTIYYKINLVIELAIAIDRLQATMFPIYYRNKSHNLFVWITLLIGIIWAIIDCVIEFSVTKYEHHYGCATIGCFADTKYKLYWGASNMALDASVLVITIIVGVQLRKIRKKSMQLTSTAKENQVEQVNKLSMGILIVGVFFLLIPSAIAGIGEFIGLGIFKHFGPFYTFGLLIAGVCNSFLYIGLHLELREAARRLICKKKAVQNNSTTIKMNNTRSQHVVQNYM